MKLLIPVLSIAWPGGQATTIEEWRDLRDGMFIPFGRATFTGRAGENDSLNAGGTK